MEDKYKELTEEKLKKILEEVFCTMPPPKRQLKLWGITVNSEGLIPFEQTPEFDRLMKEHYKDTYGEKTEEE